jgi:hypothetical protein
VITTNVDDNDTIITISFTLMLVFWVVTLYGLAGGLKEFRRNTPFPSSTLKMETVRFSRTLVCTYKSRRQHLHRHENLRSQIYFAFYVGHILKKNEKTFVFYKVEQRLVILACNTDVIPDTNIETEETDIQF